MSEQHRDKRHKSGDDVSQIASVLKPGMNVIDPYGDIILKVNDNPQPGQSAASNSYSLRVSTKVLSVASKPFRSMFSGIYMEGQNLSGKNPPTLELPDDSATGTFALCAALHHQAPAMDTKLEARPNTILEMTVIAHKYDCLDAIVPTLKLCIESAKSNPSNLPFLFQALVLAYVLDDPDAFRDISHAIVTNIGSVGDVLSMSQQFTSNPLIPNTLWFILADRLLKVRTEFFGKMRCAANEVRENAPRIGFLEVRRHIFDYGHGVEVYNVGNEIVHLDDVITECELRKVPCSKMLQWLRTDVHKFNFDQICDGEDDQDATERSVLAGIRVALDNRYYVQKRSLCLQCVKTQLFHPTSICLGCKHRADKSLCLGCSGKHPDEEQDQGRHAQTPS